MSTNKIGENAGKVWKTLKDNGQMSTSALKKNTHMSDKDVNLGLGWLARENKLDFEQKGNQTIVRLID